MIHFLTKLAFLCTFVASSAVLDAADFYSALQVGDSVYEKVYVVSVNETSLSIRHSKGLAQVKLANLGVAFQIKYGYDSVKAQQRDQAMKRSREQQAVLASKRIEKQREAAKNREQARFFPTETLTSAFASFGEFPMLKPEVDMRIAFREHSLSIRNQGFRPSCSIHSIVAALEYQYAEFEGSLVNISEDHLMRATLKSRGRPEEEGESEEPFAFRDAGFALEEVFQGISRVIDSGDIDIALKGPEAQQGFKRLL